MKYFQNVSGSTHLSLMNICFQHQKIKLKAQKLLVYENVLFNKPDSQIHSFSSSNHTSIANSKLQIFAAWKQIEYILNIFIFCRWITGRFLHPILHISKSKSIQLLILSSRKRHLVLQTSKPNTSSQSWTGWGVSLAPGKNCEVEVTELLPWVQARQEILTDVARLFLQEWGWQPNRGSSSNTLNEKGSVQANTTKGQTAWEKL